MDSSSIEIKSLRVLILEDSLMDMELIAEQLSGAGYQLDLTHADNENAFTKALMGNYYDIIISDFSLPGFDAFNALEMSKKSCPDVPFICVSGSVGEETAIELLKNGAVDYVLKDRPERLPFAIKRALDEAKEKEVHRKTVKDLIESENRFRQVAETAQEWIWEVDSNGLLSYSSPVIESLLGYTPEEVVGKKYFYDFLVPEEREILKKAIIDVFAKKEIFRNFENTNVHKNGQLVIVSTCGSPVIDNEGKFIGYRGIDEDITERKKAEENIKLLNRAVDASSVSVVITDSKGIIIYTNPFFSQLSGYSKDEVNGKNPRLLSSGNMSKSFYENLWNTILSGKDWIGEIQNKNKNGELYWENVAISPILNSEGKVTHFVAIKDDITENKKMLEELVAAKEKAEESDRLKTAFLANMSHEIRTPMNGILGFADLLKEPGLTGEKQQAYINIIEKSGTRMLNIINDIIDISKIEAGLMKLDINESNINEQIEYIYTFFKPEAENKKIMLSYKITLPSKGAIIKTDREKLYAILTNLVKNATKYTSEGSIEFGYNLRTDNCPVELEFYVKDTGVGIPKDRQEAIFERFIQADISDKRCYQGAGLGLSISKAYVEMLGGKIWVESEEGKGSTFYFTLPYNVETKTETIDRKLELSGKNCDVRKLKIMIAEDDEISEMLIDSYIKMFGKEIVKARTGAEAVEACRNNPDMDLILMDIRMPDMGAYEAIRQIREFNKEVIIIAQTAYAQSGDREKTIESGCNDYIAKPIKNNELQALIQKYFGK
jgi:PAS domain S-box-containing protein